MVAGMRSRDLPHRATRKTSGKGEARVREWKETVSQLRQAERKKERPWVAPWKVHQGKGR